MSSSPDVLVIGGGMAGAMAALRAARNGAQVLVARRALGSTALSSGAVDVAPDPSAPAGELLGHAIAPLEAARAVARVKPSHPYAVLKAHLERLPEALRFCTEALPELYPEPRAANALLPTPLGTVKPAAFAQKTQLGADLCRLPPEIAVVQFEPLPSHDAQLIASGLQAAAAAIGRPLVAHVVASHHYKRIEDPLRSPHELAAMLDEQGAAEAFAADLKPRLPKAAAAVLVPPVFGLAGGDALARASAALGVPLIELLAVAPSVPGVRLQESLDRALARAGVELVEATAECRDRALGRYSLGERGEVTAKAVVLATGKFIGGGIERDGRFRETVCELPVFASAAREVLGEWVGDLLDERIESDHLAFRAGVRVDSSLRPLGSDGAPASPALFAAGQVICGYDPASDKTGLGVAIFTGYLAGELAAKAARASPPG